MVTEHIFDFEWRPLQNYLRDRDIAIPPFAAEQESRSDALYNWIVSKGYSGKEGLNLGTYYHISDYGVIGLALLCAENVGDILKVIRAYVKLFNRDIANVGVKPRENYEVEIHISVNFKPEWNDASRQFHVNVIASATYKLIMDLLGNDFPISALTVPVHGADKTIYEGFFSLPVKHEGNDIIFSFPAHQLNRTLATANPAVFQSALTMPCNASSRSPGRSCARPTRRSPRTCPTVPSASAGPARTVATSGCSGRPAAATCAYRSSRRPPCTIRSAARSRP